MISLLKAFHEHAAKRGEGLRTEFLIHMRCGPALVPAHGDQPDRARRPHIDCPEAGDVARSLLVKLVQ